MTMRGTSWPKLIGVFVVAIGFAISTKGSEFVFFGTMNDIGTVRGYVWLVVLVVPSPH